MYRRAFTLIEFMIVMIVIAVLTGLVIVGWNAASSKAKIASLQADVTQTAKLIGIDFAARGNITYTTALSSLNQGKGASPSAGNTLTYTYNNSGIKPAYCISASNGDDSYMISSLVLNAQPGRCGTSGIVTSGLVLDLDAG